MEHLEALRPDRHVETRDRSIQDVGHEDQGVIPIIVHRQILGTIQKLRIGQGLHHMTVSVHDLQRTLADRRAGAVRGRHIAHDHEAVAQHPERRAQSRERTHKEHIGSSRRGESSPRSQLHDGGAGALKIGAVVEVADQYIAGGDRAAAREILGDERDPVRIDVPARRYRGRAAAHRFAAGRLREEFPRANSNYSRLSLAHRAFLRAEYL